MTNYPWMQIIQKDFEPFKQWYQSQQPKGSILYWAIKKGELSEQNYFDWAQNQYGMTYLHNDFFKQKSNSTLWQKYVNVHKWTNECFPVAEWDGTLFVACLQPPEDLPHFPKIVAVLANAENLDLYWKNLNSPGNLFELQDDVEEEKPVSASETDTSEENFDAPAGFDFGSPAPSHLSMPPTPVDLKSEFAVDNEATAIAVTAVAAPTLTAVVTPVAVAANPALPVQQVTSVQAIKSAVPANIYRNEFSSILEKVKSHYQKSMLLRVSGNSVVAADWDSSFHATNATDEPISLNQPSIFRIVRQTMKPYHGYIAVNDVNEKYFDEWNQGQIPDHVTIVPILNEEKVIGMLVGFADKNINKKQSLIELEKLADEASALMQKLSSSQKAIAS